MASLKHGKTAMSKLFYLQDNRGNVGANLMWWAKDGKGYTSDLDRAEVYTHDQAQAQHDCRESDIPWTKEYVDQHAERAVDMQYLSRAAADVAVQREFYLQYDGRYSGNDVVWLTPGGGTTTDPEKALRAAVDALPQGFILWPCAYIDSLSTRRVAVADKLSLVSALLNTGIVLRKPTKPPRETYRCVGCGRIMSEKQMWSGSCLNCGADSRP